MTTKSALSKLPPKRRAFVTEYLIDLNATKAAERANYSKKTAATQAAFLLQNVQVQAAIAEAVEAREHRTEITADKVLYELAKIGFANMADYVDLDTGTIRLDQITRDQAAAIGEITTDTLRGDDDVIRTRLKLSDKQRALELIGRHIGMFSKKLDVEVGGKRGRPIEVTPVPTDPAHLYEVAKTLMEVMQPEMLEEPDEEDE